MDNIQWVCCTDSLSLKNWKEWVWKGMNKIPAFFCTEYPGITLEHAFVKPVNQGLSVTT